MHHPFWLVFVVPMRAGLSDSHAYHQLVCALMLGGGVQFGFRQIGLVLIAVGGSTTWLAKLIVLLFQLAAVVFCRVALFFPLASECIQEFQVEDPARSRLMLATTFLMGCFNILAVLDSVRVTIMWCNTGNGSGMDSLRMQEQSQERLRTLELSSVAVGRRATTTAESSFSPSVPVRTLPAQSGREAPGRKKHRSKPCRHACIRDAPPAMQDGRRDNDPSREEVVFGFVGAADFDVTADGDCMDHVGASIHRTAAAQVSMATSREPLTDEAAATRTEGADAAMMRTQTQARTRAQHRRLETCACAHGRHGHGYGHGHGYEHGCDETSAQMSGKCGGNDDHGNGNRMRPQVSDAHGCGGHYPNGPHSARSADGKQFHEAAQKKVEQSQLRGDHAAPRCSSDAQVPVDSDALMLPGTCSSLDHTRIPIVNHHLVLASGHVPTVTHYAFLGVPKAAGAVAIKKAFHKLSVKFHPDKNLTNAANAEVLFMRIKEAYDCLIEPSKRRRYDKHIDSFMQYST